VGSPGYYSRVISFVKTRVAQATITLACAYLLHAPVAYGAAPGRVVVPPVFPLALVQQVTLPSMPLGAPAVGAGLAVVALADGDVVAFDLATGAETWRAQLKATHRAVVAGDAVYVVTADTTEYLALPTAPSAGGRHGAAAPPLPSSRRRSSSPPPSQG
jgi:hypothetical protein